MAAQSHYWKTIGLKQLAGAIVVTREIMFKRMEMRQLSENAGESRKMRETWQVCVSMCRCVC